MPTYIRSVLQSLSERLRQRRRAANLLAGQRGQREHAARGGALRPAWTCWRRGSLYATLALLLAGGGLLVLHARQLVRSTASTPQTAQSLRAAQLFQGVLPGVQFDVPQQSGISLSLHADAALLVLAGMQAAPAVRIDLCSQLRAGATGAAASQLVPLRLGYRFEDVQRWVRQNEAASVQIALRNVLLVAQHGAAAGMPQVQMSGVARADFNDPYSEPLQLSWQAQNDRVRWLSDASLGQIEQGAQGRVALRQQGWLMWGDQAALRIERRTNVTCPQAGELVLQLYRPAAAATPSAALVSAFPARGRPLATLLASGRYQVPASPAAVMEDETLFAALQAQGMVRLSAQGALELAPRDLPQWQALRPEQRVAPGPADSWKAVAPGALTQKLIKRLYYQADGAYVRQQVELFNSERWLLAWRVPASAGTTQAWQATSVAQAGAPDMASSQAGALARTVALAAVPLTSSGQMPLAASRLFASLPQGWQGWTRLARWPQAARAGAVPVRLQLALPRAAQGGETLQLMLLGRVAGVHGATARMAPVCSGRACRSPADVQQLLLTLNPGVRAVQLDVAALAFHSPEDQKYRHLWLDQGHIRWQALPVTPPARGGAALQSAALSTTMQLTDRHATPLWRDGVASPAAMQAGLGPLLGLGREHASSVSGMLARLPQQPQAARLTLDLPLQQLSQRLLDCVGLRHGRWEGGACVAAQTVPEGRHAGLVILDAETGDILAAAGAGAGTVNPANWAEVRDFDRTSPARSPLRLPAWQHDGGAHQSPGSTFKVVSALGLELAAQHDPQIDALLAGMPLAAINRLAQQRGFGFQTDAASYPLNPRLAHITNFREQSLDRRAQDGRLGLSQALTYSLNTWFAWSGELSDRSLFGRAEGGAPDLQALDADALDPVRPIVAAAHRLGFEQPLRLDGGLLPPDFDWRNWDALQATPAHIDPIHTRHELRQMSIGLRMQVTPLQMALASAAIGQGSVVTPRLLLALDGSSSRVVRQAPLDIRLDRIRAGMKGVVEVGTGAGAFRAAALAPLRGGLYGKTGTAPSGEHTATVWFTGWLEPGSLPGQQHRLAMAVFVSHSAATGGEHAAPVLASLLAALAGQPAAQKPEQKEK